MAKMSFGAGGGFPNEGPEEYGPELPGGGARVVRRAAQPETSRSVPDRAPLSERIEPMIRTSDASVATPAPAQAETSAPAPAADSGLAAEPTKAGPTAPEEVLILHVMAKDAGGFKGPDLLHILLACDVRYGEMDIFHRHEETRGRGPIQFSIANAVEPGTFDLNNINEFSTPGVTFFMRLPGPKDPLAAYDHMVETARCIVNNLDGKLLDRSMNPVTTRTLDSDRARLGANN